MHLSIKVTQFDNSTISKLYRTNGEYCNKCEHTIEIANQCQSIEAAVQITRTIQNKIQQYDELMQNPIVLRGQPFGKFQQKLGKELHIGMPMGQGNQFLSYQYTKRSLLNKLTPNPELFLQTNCG